MDTMIKEYLASFIRNLLAPLIVYLAATGYITENDAAQLVIAISAVVVAVIWGLANKFLWKKAAETALALPASRSDAKLSDVIAGNIPKD